MEERKSMGSALVDVFDAGVTLVKSEISSVARKVGDMAKAKGIGVVLLLAAVGPLILALVFLILAVFYGLMRLGLGAWAAALVIALLSLGVTAALVFLGLKRLSAEVHTEEPLIRRNAMTDDKDKIVQPRTPATTEARPQAAATSTTATSTTPGQSAQTRRDPVHYAAGETRVVAERPGSATLRVEGGTTTVPVYESGAGGQPQMYGSGLNEKLDEVRDVPGGRVVQPRTVPGGISVSTSPSYRQDMEKGES